MALKLRLKTLSTIWIVVSLAVGVICSGLWFYSGAQWRTYLDRAHYAGVEVYHALDLGTKVAGISINSLSELDQKQAMAGRFDLISGIPRPAYVTYLSLNRDQNDPIDTSALKIAVVSDQLQYKVADIVSTGQSAQALKFGELTRLLATYCSTPVVFASVDGAAWQRIDGSAIWGCDAAPTDYRLPAALLAILTLAVLFTQIGNTTEAFELFSRKLRSRRLEGGPDSYDSSGPFELQEIVEAVNSYLEEERTQLSKRAVVLSGVSHDLGTPATRLRLRAALIDDPELRDKLETDIDQMTGIIESVLTYTRSELNSEEPRRLSLTSLVDALIADYQDVDQPVTLVTSDPVEVTASRSVFAPRSGIVPLSEASKILMHARPTALRRAVANLIDNALKYGRRAEVSIEATSNWAIVTVEDEGGETSALELEKLLEPFERGKNVQNVAGFGLGLTIVATVARQHGGRIEFEDGRNGIRSRLWLRRA